MLSWDSSCSRLPYLNLTIRAFGCFPLVGGWRLINNPNAAEDVMIAKSVVAEHNKEKVVKGEQQVFADVNYRLVISAADSGGAVPKTYKQCFRKRTGPEIV
ncbi:hypothetical protein ACS0TY_005150 [Phlomoides rotata]